MIEVLKSFEQEASRFQPMVLLVPGLVMVVLGLIAWLAGLFLRRPVLAAICALVGGIAGWLWAGPNPAIWGPAAAGGAILGTVLPRLSTAVLLAAIGVAVVFVIATRVYLVGEQKTLSQNVGRGPEKLTVPESLRAVRVLAFDIIGRTKAAAGELEPASLVVIAAPGVVLLAAGLLFARLAGALTFSVLGTALIFVGLIVLLIYKGSAPIALVQKQGTFYGLVLLGMAAFGALEQFVLCPSLKRRPKGQAGGPHARPGESERGWRNH